MTSPKENIDERPVQKVYDTLNVIYGARVTLDVFEFLNTNVLVTDFMVIQFLIAEEIEAQEEKVTVSV